MDEKLEKLGQAIDSLDNIIHTLKLPLPDSLHVKSMRDILPELLDKLKEGFMEATGETPWE